MTKYFYCLLILASSCLMIRVAAASNEPPHRQQQPEQPSVSLTFLSETSVFVSVYGTGTTSELYRSTDRESGYQLIQTLTPGGEYRDYNLQPRTTYYYKARSKDGDSYSIYSEILEVTTESNWYSPTLIARAISSTAIEVSLTDNSYQDASYDLLSDQGYLGNFAMTDSGRTVVYTHQNLEPNKLYEYRVDANLGGDGSYTHDWAASASATTLSNDEPLEPIILYDDNVSETNIFISWTNVNPDSYTEVWRSLSEDSGYSLIATMEAENDDFLDTHLKSRTTYYYRLRAVRGEETSSYLYLSYTTFSNNYPPGLELVARDPSTVEITFTDNSYNDTHYSIRSVNAANEFYEQLILPDSGSRHSFVHSNIQSSTGSVTYAIDMTVDTYPRGEVTYEAIVTKTIQLHDGEPSCPGTGTVKRELWYNVTGTTLASVPFDTPPDEINTLTKLETENYKANYYGSRIRGYLCPAYDGSYTLYLASDDQSELWLSTDDDPGNKQRVASVPGHTAKNDYSKYPTQRSGAISLTRGQRYYFEVLHREGNGADFIQVGWRLPNSSVELSIPGDRIIPYDETLPPACATTGGINWEVWRNFEGSVDAIPTYSPPNNTVALTKFESPQYYANQYASRARGYVCVPVTGDYTFYLASDDLARLYISADDSPANKIKIAEVNAATRFNQWDKYPSQQSAPVRLETGRRYYIEVVHKEIGGNDFIQVGWKMPDGTLERPIQGNHLIPFDAGDNQSPVVNLTAPEPSESFAAPATIHFEAAASDPDGTVTKVEFFLGSNKLGEDSSAPYEYTWEEVPEGAYNIWVHATDNDGAVGSYQQLVLVHEGCSGAGSIAREVWFGVPGSSVSDIPQNIPPQYVQYINSLETPQYFANDYAARIRGYLCVPVSGSYYFYLSSDDQSELWLSSTDDAADKTKIAWVYGHTAFRNFTKYSTQKSAPVQLAAGQKYYIEILHKEANGNDHVTVAWELPDGTLESPIPGNRLIPLQQTQAATVGEVTLMSPEMPDDLTVFPNPVTDREFTVGINSPVPSDEARVQIISVNGSVIKDEVMSCGGDCSELLVKLKDTIEPGLYLLSVQQGQKRSSTKLVVK